MSSGIRLYYFVINLLISGSLWKKCFFFLDSFQFCVIQEMNDECQENEFHKKGLPNDDLLYFVKSNSAMKSNSE